MRETDWLWGVLWVGVQQVLIAAHKMGRETTAGSPIDSVIPGPTKLEVFCEVIYYMFL